VTPTPKKIQAARLKAGLTQAQAGELVGVAVRQWQRYEDGESEIPPGLWELFTLKTKPIKCPSCGHKFTLTPKPEKPAPRSGPRERAMKIEIRPGVVLRILAGTATIHCTDLENGITTEDEAKARELLPRGVKIRGE